MTAYASTNQAKDMLGGNWGPDSATGSGSQRDDILGDLCERCSRLFDRECGVPTNHFAAQAGAVRRYSGTGEQYLDIDDFDLITAVRMFSDQARTVVQTLSPTDPTSPNYVQVLPVEGAPFNRLFLLRGFLPDVFDVGNVEVTGNLTTPADVVHAVAVWVAYQWATRNAGFADAVNRVGEGGGVTYRHGVPPEVARVVAYYRDARRGPKLAVLDGDEPRVSPWLSWVTNPP